MSNQMLQIDHTLTSIAPEKQHIETKIATQSYYSNFYKVVRQLRDTDQKISQFKNRVASLGLKSLGKIQRSPLFSNSPSLRQIYLDGKGKKEKKVILSQFQMQKRINQDNSKILSKRLTRARRVMTQQKFKIHDEVRQKSLRNLRKIEEFRKQFAEQKQKIHDKLYKREKDKKNKIKRFEQKKKQQVQQFCREQVLYASKKVVDKQKELQLLKRQCQQYEKRFKDKNNKRKDKLKKIWSLRKNIGERTARDIISNTLRSFFDDKEKPPLEKPTNAFSETKF